MMKPYQIREKNRNCMIYACSITFFLLNIGLSAQEKSSSFKKEMYKRYLTIRNMVKNGVINPVWSENDDCFWFEEDGVIFKVDPEKNSKLPDNTKSREELHTTRRLPVGRPSPNKIDSPTGRHFILSKNNNIYLGSKDNGNEEQIIYDGIEDYGWQIFENGWSPDGMQFITQREDVRNVHKIPLVDYTQPLESVYWATYPKSGHIFSKTELHVYDITNKKMKQIDTGGEGDRYIFGLKWLPDASGYLYLRVSRDAKKLELLNADPKTGQSKVLITEQRDTFVAGLDFLVYGWARQAVVIDNKYLTWLSERDGWKHIYLYDIKGNYIRQLTGGELSVDNISAVNEESGWIYFTAYGGTELYDHHLYRVNMNEGFSLKRLTEKPGHHSILFSPSKKYYLDTHSSIERPPIVELRTSNGKWMQNVSEANVDALKEIKWTPPEPFIVKAADNNTDIYGVLYKPYDFNPENHYPVIDAIYQGPFTITAQHRFIPVSSNALLAQALAQLGFITFVVDGRGTPHRSKTFQDITYGNIGTHEIPDHVAALKQLAVERPYMDLSRVGVFGHSWGGYFALRAMLQAPDVFHVGIASAPGDLTEAPSINEPYMDLPERNSQGYAHGSNPALADRLKGKLLLIHGTHDVNAPMSTTMRMVTALIKAGKLHDLAILPNTDHYIREYYWYWRDLIAEYFMEHLKP